MKKLLSIAAVLSISVIIAMTGCSSGQLGGTVEGESYTTEGWIDDNTYRIAATGAPKSTLSNRIQRQESAKRAAILNAQYQILEKFKGSKLEGASGMNDFEISGMAVAQEVQGTIKGGSVTKVTYDEEQNCEIIYEIKAKGLKNKVSAAQWE